MLWLTPSRIQILEGPTSASSKHFHDLTPISGLLGASGVDLGWCWVLCPGSWVPFLRFPLWEFHVKAICFHVRVSFEKTSQNQHPQGGPFPSRSSGWGVLITCESKCSCALFTRKSASPACSTSMQNALTSNSPMLVGAKASTKQRS